MRKKAVVRKLLASRLAVARHRAGLSQLQVARKLEVSRPSISEIEAGRRRVSVEELILFSELYDVDIHWLTGMGEKYVDELRDRVQLVALKLREFDDEDLERLIELLTVLKDKL